MKKIFSTAAVALVIAAPSAFATDVQYFVGGGMGYHDAKLKVEDEGSFNASGAAYHVRGGAYIAENHRVTLTANFANNKFDDLSELAGESIKLNQTEWLASYDYVHAINDQFAVFGGATLGYINNELNLSDFKDDESDFAFGGQVGVQYKINADWSIDGAYRYMGTSYDNKEFNEKLANHSEFSISLDYRF